LYLLRRAEPRDASAAARLILEAAPSLSAILGDRSTALTATQAAFRADRTELSHRFGMVEEGDGLRGLIIAFPGRLFGSLKLGTGVQLARAAGARHAADLIRRGRVLDKLMPNPGRNVLYASVLAVAPESRGQGVGVVLLERLVAAADWMGLGVALDVGLENESARHLYEQLGFVETSVRQTTEVDRRQIPTPGMARMVRRPRRERPDDAEPGPSADESGA
jgi:ribosomal protein S18 acetylase RimI-like enzyme